MKIDRYEVLYCPVCGAELVVLKGKGGEVEFYCCNTIMKKKEKKVKAFYCEICGSELLWTFESGITPELHCCNQPMTMIAPDT